MVVLTVTKFDVAFNSGSSSTATLKLRSSKRPHSSSFKYVGPTTASYLSISLYISRPSSLVGLGARLQPPRTNARESHSMARPNIAIPIVAKVYGQLCTEQGSYVTCPAVCPHFGARRQRPNGSRLLPVRTAADAGSLGHIVHTRCRGSGLRTKWSYTF